MTTHETATQQILDTFKSSMDEVREGRKMAIASNKMSEDDIKKVETDMRALGFDENEYEFVHKTEGTKEIFTMRRKA